MLLKIILCIFVTHVVIPILNVLMMNTLLNLVMVSVAITSVVVISMSRYWNVIMNAVDTNKLNRSYVNDCKRID